MLESKWEFIIPTGIEPRGERVADFAALGQTVENSDAVANR
jgi:hypothetical protein